MVYLLETKKKNKNEMMMNQFVVLNAFEKQKIYGVLREFYRCTQLFRHPPTMAANFLVHSVWYALVASLPIFYCSLKPKNKGEVVYISYKCISLCTLRKFSHIPLGRGEPFGPLHHLPRCKRVHKKSCPNISLIHSHEHLENVKLREN